MSSRDDEVEYVTMEVLEKIFQGRTEKLELSRHIARVAVAAHWRWGDGVSAQIERTGDPLLDG